MWRWNETNSFVVLNYNCRMYKHYAVINKNPYYPCWHPIIYKCCSVHRERPNSNLLKLIQHGKYTINKSYLMSCQYDYLSTVKPVLRDHYHESPCTYHGVIYSIFMPSPTFQCHQRPLVLRNHILWPIWVVF